jgi:hypothetical protein
MRHDDAMVGRRFHVQVRQRHPDDRDQLQIPKPLEQAPRHAHPLAHRAQHVEWSKLRGRLVVRQMAIENGDLRLAVEDRPIRRFECNPHIVVKDCYPDHRSTSPGREYPDDKSYRNPARA